MHPLKCGYGWITTNRKRCLDLLLGGRSFHKICLPNDSKGSVSDRSVWLDVDGGRVTFRWGVGGRSVRGNGAGFRGDSLRVVGGVVKVSCGQDGLMVVRHTHDGRRCGACQRHLPTTTTARLLPTGSNFENCHKTTPHH